MNTPLSLLLSALRATSSDVLKAVRARYDLKINEYDKNAIQTPRIRIRPLNNSLQEYMQLSAWRLAHAVIKADCLRTPLAGPHLLATVGFVLEQTYLFDWTQEELRLAKGMSGYYADVSRSSLAGRIGQGMAILFLEKRGYSYVGHFATMWGQHKKELPRQRTTGNRRMPDFIVERADAARERALAEAKCSFLRPRNPSKIKTTLRDGLKQLEGWDRRITPQPTKSFVVGTFLRETADPSEETPLIAFVDPEPGPPEGPIDFPEDAIRRANYAAWLSLMGFGDSASSLRTGVRRKGQSYQLYAITLWGRQYALGIPSRRDFLEHDKRFAFLRRGMMFDLGTTGEPIHIGIIGLEAAVLKAIGAVLNSESPDARLMPEPRMVEDGSPVTFEGGSFYGSIFSDGSLFGEIVWWPSKGWPFESIEIAL